MRQFDQVADFHAAFGLPNLIGTRKDPGNKRFLLRTKLVQEEVAEMAEAYDHLTDKDLQDTHPIVKQRLTAALLKEIADVEYVCLGMCMEMGWAKIVEHRKFTGFDDDVLVANIRAKALHLKFLQDITDIRSLNFEILRSIGYMDAFDDIFDEVHRSNMSKLGDDGKPVYRADGKVMKGPNYTPADLSFLFTEKMQEA